MSARFQQFKALHQSDQLFVLPNVWNAKSALLFQEKQFPSIATSSDAVAASLGYADGEKMSFEEYLFVIRRITAVTTIPLSVDMEMGYGTTVSEIYAHLKTLIGLGVAGINIEDSVIVPAGRTLQAADTFAAKLAGIKALLAADGLNIFINVRCDTFLLGVENKQAESLRRITLYETAGADGIFLPCIHDTADIAQVTAHTALPLNVMCIPGLPDFPTLQQLGVKRASMGGFLFSKVYDHIGALAGEIGHHKSFGALLS